GFLTLKFINLDVSELLNPIAYPENRLLLVLAVLFIPTFDTIRVVIVRLLKGANPFEADNNHTHHLLLKMGHSHKKATFVLCLLNITVVVLLSVLAEILNMFWLSISLLSLYGISLIATILIEKRLDVQKEYTKPKKKTFEVEKTKLKKVES